MHVRRCAAAVLAGVLLAGVLLTGCAAGVPEPTGAAPPASAAPSTTAGPAATGTAAPVPTTPPSPTATVRTIAVAYAGGQVTGTSGREEVSVGESLVLRVASDVAEEVHVHGYDLSQPVPAGGAVDIPVTATLPGVFEVELHEAGKALFQLRVG